MEKLEAELRRSLVMQSHKRSKEDIQRVLSSAKSEDSKIAGQFIASYFSDETIGLGCILEYCNKKGFDEIYNYLTNIERIKPFKNLVTNLVAQVVLYPALAAGSQKQEGYPNISSGEFKKAVRTSEKTMQDFYENQQVLISSLLDIAQEKGLEKAMASEEEIKLSTSKFDKEKYLKGMAVIGYLSFLSSNTDPFYSIFENILKQ